MLSRSVVSNSLQPRGQRSLAGYSPSPVLAWILQARILERVAMPSSGERAEHHAHINAANRLSFFINSMYGWVLPAQIFLMAPRYYCFWDLSFIWIPPTDPHQIWKRDSHCLGRGFYVKQWFSPKGEFTSQKTFSNAQKLSGCHRAGRMPLASDGSNPKIFLCTGRLLQQRIIQPKMATVPRLKNLEVER